MRLGSRRDRLSAPPAREPLQPARPRPLTLACRAARTAPVVLCGAGAAIPVINSTVKAVRAGWMPAGDDGIIATRGWDVLSAHTPLIGQYSEAGLVIPRQVVHSPGPMLYWLLALPARLGSVASLAVTMGAVNTLAIVGCVAIARRRGGYPLMIASGLAIALMCQSLPTESLHDIWNPAAGLFPFLLLVFAGWSLACGQHRLLPLTVLLASFVVQTHVMYLAPSCVVLIVALGGLALHTIARRRERRERAAGRLWPWALGALAVLAICWTAPVTQQLEEHPGNLTLIVRSVEHRGRTLGAGVGWHALVRAIGSRPWWLYVPSSEWERKRDVLRALSTTQQNVAIAVLAALGLVLVGAAVLRRLDLGAAALIALGLCGVMVAQVASNPSSKLLEETLGYTLWWGSELGLWVSLVLAWALWLALARLLRAPHSAASGALARAGPRLRTLALGFGALAGTAGVALAGSAVAETAKPDSHVYEYRPISAMAKGIERVVPAGISIDYRLGPLDLGTQPMEPALRFLLVRHGDRVLAEGSYPRLGSYYVLGDRPYQWIVYLRDGTRAQLHMRLAARVRFEDQWGIDVLSAWVKRAPASLGRARPGVRVRRRTRA